MEKLLAAPSYEAVVAMLQERGWTMPEDTRDSGKILDLELSRAWAWVLKSAPDPKLFHVLILRNDYHNLKAGIKCLEASSFIGGFTCTDPKVAVVKRNNGTELWLHAQQHTVIMLK